ncbi:type II secretion system protein [Prosthecobacter vanneervenii]|uniref:Prepilin-type N-terminal cleavage/methylation domain-containing protein n=1 Tax=Prosthecobacter vanneervenii TaxID=48466 RepID=A0A7W8DMF2_9BACT|nr:prepilin-type N-terminal cleavage/methylation domain-containing protein [Prosthecobacter vanneervenii]MBB5035177.1 prepilin-type N-terminal cleavage/methylation domain-containing protein [Prosthecobacter vanneervenii]
MKISQQVRSDSGVTLAELLVVILILGILGTIVVPNMGFLTVEADKVKDKRNAQNIMLAYSTGVAAGVSWPAGDVATQVAAVIVGRKPAGGPMARMTFQSAVGVDDVAATYQYIGVRSTGELYFDSTGGQSTSGH